MIHFRLALICLAMLAVASPKTAYCNSPAEAAKKPAEAAKKAEMSEKELEAKRIGCFKDEKKERDLDGFLGQSKHNDGANCIGFCKHKKFKFAGTQFGKFCECGNDYGAYGEAKNCNHPCAGNPKEMCGGPLANTVYAVDEKAPHKPVPMKMRQMRARNEARKEALLEQMHQATVISVRSQQELKLVKFNTRMECEDECASAADCKKEPECDTDETGYTMCTLACSHMK